MIWVSLDFLYLNNTSLGLQHLTSTLYKDEHYFMERQRYQGGRKKRFF